MWGTSWKVKTNKLINCLADATFGIYLFHANCGVCAEAGNAEALSKCIVYLYQNKQLEEMFGSNARQYAETNVSKSKAVAMYLQVIETIVDKEK